MWIETNKNSAEIRQYFLSQKEIKIQEKTYKIIVSPTDKNGTTITVEGISQAGIQTIADAEEMTQIGYKLYELLKNAPDFRYALTGIEVDNWRTFTELAQDPAIIKDIKGFVINKDIYTLIKCTAKMTSFRKNYFWIPYQRETCK